MMILITKRNCLWENSSRFAVKDNKETVHNDLWLDGFKREKNVFQPRVLNK